MQQPRCTSAIEDATKPRPHPGIRQWPEQLSFPVVVFILRSPGSLPSFARLCEECPSRNLVDWHSEHVTKPAQSVECDRFIYRGRVRSAGQTVRQNYLDYLILFALPRSQIQEGLCRLRTRPRRTLTPGALETDSESSIVVSVTKLKRKGEIGQPCLIPLYVVNSGEIFPGSKIYGGHLCSIDTTIVPDSPQSQRQLSCQGRPLLLVVRSNAAAPESVGGTWSGKMAQWLESNFTARKVRVSNPSFASRFLLGVGNLAVSQSSFCLCVLLDSDHGYHPRCPTVMPPEGSMRTGILPGCPSLHSESCEAEVGFEPRTFR
ncbi:hypothetical protein CSKR_105248 [Clonorchis sinensis]|uniref:Uncharacterized protein n=1 Tax=Clonorchis sinensis TaxID=79923 RepID=A0A3R7D8M6_CLOSI|nr:hypothetical protein CSKR_105248 [Clonorchis sinensis]